MPRLALVAACLLAACSAAPPSPVEHVDSLALYPTPRYLSEVGLGVRYAHPQLLFDSALPPDLDPAARAAWDAGGVDRFVLLSRLESGQAIVRAYAESARATGYATAVAKSLVDDQGRIHFATVVDGALFGTRGIIEGHYGAPLVSWQRRCLIDRLGTLRGNLYLYGPKDDPYAHARWADPYPPADAAAIVEAVATARARGVDFAWSVSPGLQQNDPPPGASISFSSDGDFARLTAKIDAMRALGVERFALFLDDTDKSLVYAADASAFATPAAAHAALANRLDAYVTAAGAPHLLFVGPYYTTRFDGWRDWAVEIGQRLAPGIEILWTGPAVYSDEITVADLADPNAAFGRRVTIWDNQPRGPAAIDGRDATLPTVAAGFLSNTIMLQTGYGYRFDDFWQILGPLADYAWNPLAYEPNYSLGEWATILLTADPCGESSDPTSS
jgi:hypothetical protein